MQKYGNLIFRYISLIHLVTETIEPCWGVVTSREFGQDLDFFPLPPQVSAMIGNIRNMSNDMNTALVRQNNTLDRVNNKAGSDITRVKMANERAAALMK